ncbi:hypothetical protein ACFSTH_18040 [Paenibacillus yanchengensis]|uniref:Aldose epimerase n=1 Tax=Paenibacillus yanchengensis TaxID=2035833 RepID=A0ABW4YP49_9BACL
MFTYQIKKEKFTTYVLQHASQNSYIEIVPERGAIISSYFHQNQQIFYMDQETLVDESTNIRGGNPILFPISSYLENETYYYNDAPYQLKQHGFVRQLIAKVTAIEANQHYAAITLDFTHTEATLERFPFQFKLTMKYTLNENGLSIQATVNNLDDKTMPFYLGYHPYFYVADKQALELQVPSSHYNNMVSNSMVDGKFQLNQTESNAIFDQLENNQCHILDHARDLKITLTSDDVFQYIVLWALQEKPFVCVEPWMAPVNGMNVNKGVQYLEAGRQHTSTIHIAATTID